MQGVLQNSNVHSVGLSEFRTSNWARLQEGGTALKVGEAQKPWKQTFEDA